MGLALPPPGLLPVITVVSHLPSPLNAVDGAQRSQRGRGRVDGTPLQRLALASGSGCAGELVGGASMQAPPRPRGRGLPHPAAGLPRPQAA